MKLTEKEFKKACKKLGCYYPEWHIVCGEVANTEAYLRVYFEEYGRKEYKEEVKKMLNRFIKDIQKEMDIAVKHYSSAKGEAIFIILKAIKQRLEKLKQELTK